MLSGLFLGPCLIKKRVVKVENIIDYFIESRRFWIKNEELKDIPNR
jgi:hypothetical protein